MEKTIEILNSRLDWIEDILMRGDFDEQGDLGESFRYWLGLQSGLLKMAADLVDSGLAVGERVNGRLILTARREFGVEPKLRG